MKRVFSLLLALLLFLGTFGKGERALAAEEEPPEQPALTKEHVAYIKGDKDLVRPKGKLSRAEAATLIFSLLEEPYEARETEKFTDVKTGQWFQPQVDALTERGILHGYQDGSFRPGNKITRAEFLCLLSEFFPKVEGGEAFSDVQPSHWAYEAVSSAVARGWVTGYEDGTFRPKGEITRAEAIVMTNRALGRSADEELLEAEGKVLCFLDLPLSHWAYYDVMEAALPHEVDQEAQGVERWAEYTIPPAGREDGLHVVGDGLYLAENGLWARNRTCGVLEFGDDGRYSSGNASLDSALTAVIKNCGEIKAGSEESLEKLYRYVINHYSYRGGSMVELGAENWEPDMALEMATAKKGNCYRFTALFAMLARRCGFQARGISGEVNFNTGSGWGPHSWVEIELDGKIWLCDPDVEYVYPHMDMFLADFTKVKPSYRLNGQQR